MVEETGAFGSKDDFQALANDLKSFEGTRKGLAERLESLATAKEAEVVRLRSDLKTARAAIPVAPPKITVVDDNEVGEETAGEEEASGQAKLRRELPRRRNRRLEQPRNRRRGKRRLRRRSRRQRRKPQ